MLPRLIDRFRSYVRSPGRPDSGTVVLAVVVCALLISAVAGPAFANGPTGDSAVDSSDGLDAVEPAGDLDDPDDIEAFVDGQIAGQKKVYDVPGVTVAVVNDGEPVLLEGYGYADVSERQPVDPNETSFQVGSVSKVPTWMAVLQGVDDDRLDLDEDVNAYLDDSSVEVADTYDESITLDHLGTHTAGFEERNDRLVAQDGDEIRTLEEALATDPPERVRPPGEVTAYSNYGTALAGHVVAEEYDAEFEDHVETELFEPLEMHDSTFEQPLTDDQRDRHAYPHARADGELTTQEYVYVNEAPAGAMTTTAADMTAFMSAALDGEHDGERVLDPETVDDLHDQRFTNHEATAGMSYGLMELRGSEPRAVGHGGDLMGAHAQVILLPEEDVGVFVAYNGAGGAQAKAEFTEAFLDRYAPSDREPPERSANVSSDTIERAERVSGEYRSTRAVESSWHRVLSVVSQQSVDAREDGTIVTSQLGGLAGHERWVEVEPYVYQSVDGDERIAFEVDDDGAQFTRDRAPIMAAERVPWHQGTLFVLGTAGLSLGVLALTPFLWGGTLLWRWRTDRPHPPRRPLLARAGAASLGGLAIAFVVLLMIGLGQGEVALASGTPLPIHLALFVPYAMGLVTIGVLATTGLAWRDEYWSRTARVHYAIVALAAIVFLRQIVTLGLVA